MRKLKIHIVYCGIKLKKSRWEIVPETKALRSFWSAFVFEANKFCMQNHKSTMTVVFLSISLGGLFSPLPNDNDHQTTDPQEIAFRYAVDKINADNKILPRSKLHAEIERIMPQDSFHASKRVCHLMKTGVAAIFGPQSSHTASHVQSICDTMEVS